MWLRMLVAFPAHFLRSAPHPVISGRRHLQRGLRSWRNTFQAQGSQEAAQAGAEQGQGPFNSGSVLP